MMMLNSCLGSHPFSTNLQVLAVTMAIVVFTLASIGAPLNDTGHFIWKCYQPDEFGER